MPKRTPHLNQYVDHSSRDYFPSTQSPKLEAADEGPTPDRIEEDHASRLRELELQNFRSKDEPHLFSQKFATHRKQETPKPVPHPAPALASSQFGRRPLAPVNGQGFVTHNGFLSLDAFLIQLQDEAFDSMKLSMMEASIRQFHLIAADADVQLTRQLCSIKTANVAEKRLALIEEHKQFMEAQASSLLTDMSALHDQWKEQQTMPARGLFDIPVDEDGWGRPLPPSAVSWKTAPPLNQPKPSDSWKLSSSPPKTMEAPKSQPPPKPSLESESTMPSFWKPSWDADLTEPPTPQVPPISRLATVEDVPDEDEDEDVPEPVAPAPVPKSVKPAPVPVHQPIPVKTQLPSVAEEPTPIWGQPWRKGRSHFSPIDDFSLTARQQEKRQSLTLRTRRRNPLRSLLHCPLLSKSPLLHHRSLLLPQTLSLHLLQPPHQFKTSPRMPNSFGRRGIVKAKTRQR